ncbi:leucine-rich repeat-containing G-protein coupled receptor 4-like [Anopheles aquasalis]|uniref:leucine-rich repeat-containing G-protein coupled receptor 4-like n=1 Tax=Anopheles aquasalis TaxID=42839 RepID=UPI00215B62C2|nr:leucine-rich repeat-containing G-protein coupled receptor 4-like [Anopheles aquasalis]
MSLLRGIILSLLVSGQFYLGLAQNAETPVQCNGIENCTPAAPKSSFCYNVGFEGGYKCILKNFHIGESQHVTTEFFADHEGPGEVVTLQIENSTIYRIPKVLFSVYPKLTRLNLTALQIRAFERGAFERGKELRELQLDYNNITHLESDAFEGLRWLDLLTIEDNALSHLPVDVFASNTRLMIVSMSKNNLSRIEDNTFRNNRVLRVVHVSKNRIEHFDLSQLLEAFEIDVSYNRLAELKVPPRLNSLEASHNRINAVLSNGQNRLLRKMNLSHNKLTDISWASMFAALNELDLGYNEIEQIKQDQFTAQLRLYRLLLNNNRLITFEPATLFLSPLRVLDLSYNRLTSVDRSNLLFDRLYVLHLHNNAIVKLQLTRNNNLQNITLAGNEWDCAKLRRQLRIIDSNAIFGGDESCKAGYNLVQQLCCKKSGTSQ